MPLGRAAGRHRVLRVTLHRALKKSHDSEMRLLKKCRELSTDISATSTKVSTAQRLSAGSTQTTHARA